MADEDRLDVTDIASSPAFLALNELINDGTLTAAQVEFYKSKYAKLHEVVLQTYENEKNLLRKAKDLNEDLRKVACQPSLCHATHLMCGTKGRLPLYQERTSAEELGGKDKEIREELEQTRTEFAKVAIVLRYAMSGLHTGCTTNSYATRCRALTQRLRLPGGGRGRAVRREGSDADARGSIPPMPRAAHCAARRPVVTGFARQTRWRSWTGRRRRSRRRRRTKSEKRSRRCGRAWRR
eukprot:1535607-Rhodomonas_salina.1